ncbi:MAG: hypothetical protein J7M03_06585 [Candidatus Desulfofervidaceae bacterium]|nr:hypothetical protein [Candidatus Desulfofervidaceae bacterium]
MTQHLKWTPQTCIGILKKITQTLKNGHPVYRCGRNFYTLRPPATDVKPCHLGQIALFWDGSYFFGLLVLWQLKRLGLPFAIITAEEIKQGKLKNYHILLVPGGWTNLKNEALGEEGRKAIKEFVAAGGNYLGICGGSGLALAEKDGLGLISCQRKKERKIANFYGKIHLVPMLSHPIWEGFSKKATFYVWWPGLFALPEFSDVQILATYGEITPDFFVTDLNVADLKKYDEIKKWETHYRLKISPENIKNQPAIIEGKFGKGKVILTYPHLDTPSNPWEALALFNLWQYLSPSTSGVGTNPVPPPLYPNPPQTVLHIARKLKKAMQEFMNFGKRHFLWYQVSPWMFRWRKGIRGFHYTSLYFLILEIEKYLKYYSFYVPLNTILPSLERLSLLLPSFLEKAKRLLLQERLYLNHPDLTLLKAPVEDITRLRQELFGHTPAFGGKLKEILTYVDKTLMPFLKLEGSLYEITSEIEK